MVTLDPVFAPAQSLKSQAMLDINAAMTRQDLPRGDRRGALASALALVALAACGREAAPGAKPRLPPQVVVAPVEHRDVPVEVRAPVDLRSLVQVDVGSKTLGYLDAVLVDRGDVIKRGQLLALVRPSDLPEQLTGARSALAQADSAAALARADLDRATALAPKAVVSQQELQQATARHAQAVAAAETVRAQISALAIRLGETRITAPFAGVVVQRRLDPGALVGPPGGGAIVTLAKVDVLRVFISVNERELAALRVGQNAHVEFDALPGRSWKGQVVRLAPNLDPGTRTLDAEVDLDNQEGVLRPGMYGRGAIVLAIHAGALVVPVGAVQFSEGRKFVFVAEGDVVHRREIQVGTDGGSWLEVTGGLRAQDRVVTDGVDMLADGMKIRVGTPAPVASSSGGAAGGK
ncbi:MAG TPA: efflux RND transporter periplasmic adaptor subunit [Polyangia bacterium]|nr:efflux RND transporter periplasmic adaptor subunit [Polyangia bacterium]